MRSRAFVEELYMLVNQIEKLKLKRNQTVWKDFGKEARNKRRNSGEVTKMKYVVVYTGCQIVEADSKDEAMKRFHEENFLMETEEFAYAKPCFENTDALDDACSEECWRAANKVNGYYIS